MTAYPILCFNEVVFVASNKLPDCFEISSNNCFEKLDRLKFEMHSNSQLSI